MRAVTRAILRAGGSEEEEAAIVADHLVDAHLSGHDSHGVGMIPRYFEALRRGELRPNRHITILRDEGPLLVVDGNRGYGHVMAREATAHAIDKARKEGFALLALRNACHIGRVGTYGEQCAAAGMVSLHFVNAIGRSPLVAPHGGTDARLPTNPVVCAFPAGEGRPPFLLDMATSRIALGKARVAMMRGESLAEGSVLDAAGRPTRDPAVMFAKPHGALLPLGEHKGYGLAMAAELLAGVLTGGGTIQPGNPRTDTTLNNMLAFVVDPARLVDPGFLGAEVAAMLDYAKASPPADPAVPVLVAGEPERLARRDRLAQGIEIEQRTWAQLMEAAESVGLARSEVAAICERAKGAG